MNTRDQRYAVAAYRLVGEIPADQRQKYGAMAHQLPMLIHSAGLAQALGFVESRNDAVHNLLLDHLAAVIGVGGRAAFASRSRTDPLLPYMHLTRDALAALLWFKRFADPEEDN